MERVKVASIAAKALKTRKTFLDAGPHIPICPYALCESMGFDLRFVKISSFEGMYIADQNLILISSERPEGRKRFTCAHEIGHHVLGHGTNIDEIIESGSNKAEENEADLFASMLLMPSSAVSRIISQYKITPDSIKPNDAYILSKYFGVSYIAFITHIYNNLNIITHRQYQELKKIKLHEIRLSISGVETNNQVFYIDSWWDEKAIELEIGDIIVSPKSLFTDGPQLLEAIKSDSLYIYKAIRPGITRLYNDNWSSFSKVSRHKFQGFFQYKYEEDDE